MEAEGFMLRVAARQSSPHFDPGRVLSFRAIAIKNVEPGLLIGGICQKKDGEGMETRWSCLTLSGKVGSGGESKRTK